MYAVLMIGVGRSGSLSFMRWATPLLLVFAVILGGCEMTDTQERTATGVGVGAAAGAAGGALFGAMAGAPGTGAAIGAAVGAAGGGAGGYIYDQHKKGDEAEAENERLRRENEELKKQNQQ